MKLYELDHTRRLFFRNYGLQYTAQVIHLLSMRIIGGTAKGKRLTSFRGMSIRPTTDKVREAVFNILSLPFSFKKVLDIFAGTGAMGIEALSRGAETATFIDKDAKSVKIIKRNLELCGLDDRAKVVNMEVLSALNLASRKKENYDLIFIDPPYLISHTETVLVDIADKGLLAEEGIIVSESSKRNVYDGEISNIQLFDRRKYGDTVVSFYRQHKQL